MENSSGLPSAGQLLKKSWELYKARFKTLILVSLIGTVVIFVVAMIFGGTSFLTNDMAGQGTPSGMSLVTMLIMVIVIMVVAVLEQGALVSSIASPTDTGVGPAYRVGWKKFGPFLWTSFLGGIIVAIGFILLIVPGIILAVWFSVASYVVFLEGKSGWAALSASKDYVSGRWGKVFVYLIVMIAVLILLSLIGGFLGQIGNIVVNLLVTPWTVVYCYVVYQALRSNPQTVVANATVATPATPTA